MITLNTYEPGTDCTNTCVNNHLLPSAGTSGHVPAPMHMVIQTILRIAKSAGEYSIATKGSLYCTITGLLQHLDIRKLSVDSHCSHRQCQSCITCVRYCYVCTQYTTWSQ